KGQAMDFHIEGIALSNIRKAALSMRARSSLLVSTER
ncbi:DUF882 domain-containing protein, partial [Citrobacter freundii]